MRKRWIVYLAAAMLAGALGGTLLGPAPVGAVAREIVELQQSVNQLIQGQKDMQTTLAQNAAVDKTLIVPLGLTPTGAGMFHTPSTGATPVPFPQYDVMLFIPGSKVGQAWIIEAMPVMECDLSAQGIQGLIGRDVLDRAIVVYNGPVNHFTVAY